MIDYSAILFVILLLLAVGWVQISTHRKAKRIAVELTTSLRASEEKFSSLVNMSREGIASLDASGSFNFANPYLLQLLGHEHDALMGRPFLSVVGEAEREAVAQHLMRHRQGLSESYDTVLVDADGRRIDVHIAASVLQGKRSDYLGSILVVTDISEWKRREKQIRHMAEHDPLTGLPNRTIFMEHLTQAMRRARRYERAFALAFIDLDRFKAVNDSFGHQVGDLALVEAAKRMQSVIRDVDLLCRHGGDEFMLLFSEIGSPKNIHAMVEKIQAVFAEPFIVEKHRFSLSVSVGVAIYPDHATEVDELVWLADRTMYAAKALGRDTYLIYSPESAAFSR